MLESKEDTFINRGVSTYFLLEDKQWFSPFFLIVHVFILVAAVSSLVEDTDKINSEKSILNNQGPFFRVSNH